MKLRKQNWQDGSYTKASFDPTRSSEAERIIQSCYEASGMDLCLYQSLDVGCLPRYGTTFRIVGSLGRVLKIDLPEGYQQATFLEASDLDGEDRSVHPS